jgi:hypothetical protein
VLEVSAGPARDWLEELYATRLAPPAAAADGDAEAPVVVVSLSALRAVPLVLAINSQAATVT